MPPEGAPSQCFSVSQAVFSALPHFGGAHFSLSSLCMGTRQTFSKDPELFCFLFFTFHRLSLLPFIGKFYIACQILWEELNRKLIISHFSWNLHSEGWGWVETDLQTCMQMNTTWQMVANALKENYMPCHISLFCHYQSCSDEVLYGWVAVAA